MNVLGLLDEDQYQILLKKVQDGFVRMKWRKTQHDFCDNDGDLF